MKIEINFPKKSGDVEEIRKLFKDQITEPIRKIIREFSLDDYLLFYHLDMLDEAPTTIHGTRIAAGCFYHIEQDLDDVLPHYFYFYLDGYGLMTTCSYCKQKQFESTWGKIIRQLMIMLKKELRKMKESKTKIKKIGKTIALLK